MRLYATAPVRRTLQIVGDVLAVLWLVLAIWLGHQVHDALSSVGDQVRKVDSASSSLSSGLGQAGDVLDGTPIVGDDVSKPFDRAADSSDRIGRASLDTAEKVDTLGGVLGAAVTLGLLLVAAPWWLPGRVRFVVTATLLDRFLREGGDPDLLALRAIARQPVGVLVRRQPDAAARWRAGDPEAIRALAALELRAAGVALPARPSSGGPPAPSPA